MLDWTHGITAVVSGASSFWGTFSRFRQRVTDLEQKVKDLGLHVDVVVQGWRLEWEHYKHESLAVEAARKEERSSRPDPLELASDTIRKLELDVQKLKERRGRYVHNEDFVAFVRSQEESWRKMERTLGQLEGELKKTP